MSTHGDTRPETRSVRTGVPAVDAVVASVDDLRDRPLDEHAAVFESAHDQLRRALDQTDDPTDDPTPDPNVDPGD